MAAESPLSPRLPYNSPPPVGKSRPRHNSTRTSSYSNPLPPSIESPRTLCPRDIDAFSFSPAHLPYWCFDEALWKNLPEPLKELAAHFQRSGAAVLTGEYRITSATMNARTNMTAGFERLEEHSGHITTFTPKPTEDEMLVQLDDSISSLRSLPKLDTDSSISSYHVTSSPTSSTQSPSMSASQGSQISPVSPISLAADVFPDGMLSPNSALASSRTRERSFSTPVDPIDAYYRNELSQLRIEAIPRLRHAAIRLGIEWQSIKSSGKMAKEEVEAFQRWWDERKIRAEDLDEKTRRLSDFHGLTPHGLGWCE